MATYSVVVTVTSGAALIPAAELEQVDEEHTLERSCHRSAPVLVGPVPRMDPAKGREKNEQNDKFCDETSTVSARKCRIVERQAASKVRT